MTSAIPIYASRFFKSDRDAGLILFAGTIADAFVRADHRRIRAHDQRGGRFNLPFHARRRVKANPPYAGHKLVIEHWTVGQATRPIALLSRGILL